MKATVDGVTYEGTEAEIRRIVENPPGRTAPVQHPGRTTPVQHLGWVWQRDGDYPRNWDGSPAVTC